MVDDLLLGEPLTAQPPIEEVEGVLRLVHGDHVTGLVDLHEAKVLSSLDLAVLLLSAGKLEVLN
jgi:hypothetical protein